MDRNYHLIVFDWDGTLMDSEARIVACIRNAATDTDLPVPSHAQARDIIGLGLNEAVARLFPDNDASAHQALIQAYRAHWLGAHIDTSVLFAGAAELVSRLHQNDYLLGVATGMSRRGLDRELETSGLATFFHATRCADEAHSKPHPQMLEDILTDLDTPADATLVVGDTEYDMQMAASAGADAVGVSHGVHEAERLLKAGAGQSFDDLTQLRDWLLPSSARPMEG